MNRDYLKGRRCMVWSFMQNARMYEALRDYGDRLDTVGIFTFEVDRHRDALGNWHKHFLHDDLHQQVDAHSLDADRDEPRDSQYFHGSAQ